MPRITCSMCVCMLQTFHAAQRFFIFHELLVSAVCWWSLCTPHHQHVGPCCLPQHHAEALHNLSKSQRSTKTEKVYERLWMYMVQFHFRRIQLHFLCIQLRVWLHSRAQHQRLNWERPNLEPSGLQDCTYTCESDSSEELRMGPYSARMSMASWACEPHFSWSWTWRTAKP